MCPTYEYKCGECDQVFDTFTSIGSRNNTQACTDCGGDSHRIMLTPPQTRTQKTSRTFLDGQRNDGYSEEIKAAGLDSEAMNHSPKSDKYRELKAEAKARRLLNNSAGKRGKRYRLSTGERK